MRITIIAVGKRHDQYVASGIEDFSARIRKYAQLEWKLLPHAGADELTSRRTESKAILDKLADKDIVVLLDERGMLYDSPALAQQLGNWQLSTKDIVIVIGGAYGVDEELQRRADYVWSLSKLVFPHQLVRLIVAEQIYRAFTIIKGEPYHHS